MPENIELGLETLLAVKSEYGVDLDNAFVKACFEIQKKYQFSHDRTLSTQAMDNLIEKRVDATGEKQTEDRD